MLSHSIYHGIWTLWTYGHHSREVMPVVRYEQRAGHCKQALARHVPSHLVSFFPQPLLIFHMLTSPGLITHLMIRQPSVQV